VTIFNFVEKVYKYKVGTLEHVLECEIDVLKTREGGAYFARSKRDALKLGLPEPEHPKDRLEKLLNEVRFRESRRR